MTNILPPFKIKTVEPIFLSSKEEREEWIKQANYNLFNLKSEQVIVDFLTDSGTAAMSAEQTAHLITGDESYAGARSYGYFSNTIGAITGFKHIYPVHQGRAAERILFTLLTDKTKIVPNNNHYDTTRANIEFTGAEALDLVDESNADFKGNMDIAKLKSLLERNADIIPIIMITITNNTGGGQPVSMQNIKDVSNLAKQFNKPFFIDSCRFAENAYFIKTREKGYSDISIEDIVREIFSYADGMTMSAKKDAIAHIGGWLAVNDDKLAEKIENLVILTEGFKTYGGLAGRDLEAIATGMISGLKFDYLEHRIGQVEKLGKLLQEAGVPIVNPTGGHAVYVNAKEFLSHIPPDQFPAAALAVAVYIEGGIRGSEVGSLMFGKNAAKELLRLAIPRRVYGSEHIEYVASIFAKIVKRKNNIKGMKIIKEPQSLRHFSALLDYA